MLRKYFVLITMAASLVIGSVVARAQDAGALLDLLVKNASSPIRKPRKCGAN